MNKLLTTTVLACAMAMPAAAQHFDGKTVTYIIATNPGGNNPQGQIAANVIDGLDDKWLDLGLPPATLQLTLPEGR